jgi:hypothetical protein
MRRVFCLCVLAAALGRAAPDEALENFLQRIASEQLAHRREAVARLATPEQIRQRQAEIRATLRRFMGGLPAERTPLNLRRTGVLQRSGYRIEKILYESLPGFYVTGNLYIPTAGTPPYPAVLQPVGHSQTAKARELYQSLSIGLVRSGFVVLTFDPIGQGERTIFFDDRLQASLVGSSTREHQMVGVQSLLGGESLARYRVWDGMRGIDVLESVGEVDGERIGVAGFPAGAR